MSAKELLERALRLTPDDRFTLAEALIKSPDEPDRNLDEIWTEESERRLEAYREGGGIRGTMMRVIFSRHAKHELKDAIRYYEPAAR